MAKRNNKSTPKLAQVAEMSATLTDADVAVISSLEEGATNTPVVEANTSDVQTVQPEAGQQTEIGDFIHAAGQVSDEQCIETSKVIAKSFDERSEFEKSKNPDNDRIHKTLNKTRAKLTLPSTAAILIAAQVEPDFINRSIAQGSRYNVYAAEKVADLVKGLQDGILTNKINIAIAKSIFRFRAAGEAFTGDMAKAATCDKVKVNREIGKLLVRHNVSTGTMSTQSSSTLTALQTLGIIENKGTVRAPVYTLTDTPQTKRLEQVLAV